MGLSVSAGKRTKAAEGRGNYRVKRQEKNLFSLHGNSLLWSNNLDNGLSLAETFFSPEITMEGDVTFQILMSCLQLCKTIGKPIEIILIIQDGICNW